MLDLPGVTLLAADTVHPALALRALVHSQRGIRFARTVLLTDIGAGMLQPPPGVDLVPIAPLRTRDDYSQLMLKGLREHVVTPHVLVVQWDGYVVNPVAWNPAFLECDYIGARWFWYDDAHRVGNGGFSLRSRRLLDALQDPRVSLVEAEDLTIGRTARPLLEQAHGIRFATEALADRFAFEAAYPIGQPFGFHGLFNFARVVPPAEIAALAPQFDDAIARSPQLAQLVRNCVAMGQWHAAGALAQRRLDALPDDVEARQALAQARANAERMPSAGRNEPCPCGSGRRYKQCHGALGAAHTRPPDEAPSNAAGTTLRGGVAPPSVDADDAPATIQRGIAAHQRGDRATAERHYRAGLERSPDHPLALHYLGVLEYEAGRLATALPLLERSIALVPHEPEFHNNLGLALADADRLDEARAAYRTALRLNPAHAAAWNNLGLAEAAAGNPAEADAAYRSAQSLLPEFAAARWNHALALLALGRYAEGWDAYEARLSIPQFAPLERPPVPRWDGVVVPGGRLLVLAEQGLGDTLHFIRLARTLAERGVHVIARVPPKLATLAATVPGVAEVSVGGGPWPAADAAIPLLSLPGLLDVEPGVPPARIPYVAVDATRRAAASRAVHAVAAGRPAIGLAWAGATTNTNDRRRSVALATLVPLLERTDVAFFSLQHEDDADVAAVPAAHGLHRLPERIDFDDMAALVDVLDLVITVDTSIAHLCGALGKPAWVLLPFAPDWRWGRDGEATAWYASLRLFRQPRTGDWGAVIAAVLRALDALSPRG